MKNIDPVDLSKCAQKRIVQNNEQCMYKDKHVLCRYHKDCKEITIRSIISF